MPRRSRARRSRNEQELLKPLSPQVKQSDDKNRAEEQGASKLDPKNLSSNIMYLQRTIGNQAVRKLLEQGLSAQKAAKSGDVRIQRTPYLSEVIAADYLRMTSSQGGKRSAKTSSNKMGQKLPAGTKIEPDDDFISQKAKTYIWTDVTGQNQQGWFPQNRTRSKQAMIDQVAQEKGIPKTAAEMLVNKKKYTLDDLKEAMQISDEKTLTQIFDPVFAQQLIKMGVPDTKLKQVFAELVDDFFGGVPEDYKVVFDNYFGKDVWIIANVFRSKELSDFFMNEAVNAEVKAADVGKAPKFMIVKNVVNTEAKAYFEQQRENGNVKPGKQFKSGVFNQVMNLGLFKATNRVLQDNMLKAIGGRLLAGDGINILLELESEANESTSEDTEIIFKNLKKNKK